VLNLKSSRNYESEYELVDVKEEFLEIVPNERKNSYKSETRAKIHFQPYWLDETDSNGDKIKTYIKKSDEFHVHCTLCNKTFQTHNSGRSAIEKHIQSKSHLKIANLKFMVK